MKSFFYSFLSLLLFASLAKALHSAPRGETPSLKQSAGNLGIQSKNRMCFYEKERRLLVFALHNESQETLLDHLARSLAQPIADRLRTLNYVSVNNPRRLLCLGSELTQKSKEHRRHYSREGGFTREGELALLSRERERKSQLKQQNRVQLIVKHKNTALAFQKGTEYRNFLKTAADFQVEYLLAGRLLLIDSEEEKLRYEFSFLDAIHNRLHSFSIDLRRNRPYASLDDLVQKIQNILWGKNAVLVSFQSSPQAGAMVYLNDSYLGRTPLTQKVLAGKYRLRVMQEGYQSVSRTIDIAAHKKRHFQITNTSQQGKASLYIQSQPSDAAVHLNLRYLGKTPLRMKGLPSGTHQLRLSKEGHVDTYVGVRLEENKEQRLNLSMRPGNTLAYYKNWQYVVGSLTYFDLTLYSSLSSVAFYAGWAYFKAQGEKAEDRGQRGEGGLRQNSKAERNYQHARLSASLSILSLLSAGYFLYRGLSIGEDPGFGEVSAPLPALELGPSSKLERIDQSPQSSGLAFGGKRPFKIHSKWEIEASVKQFAREKVYRAGIHIRL